MFIIVYRIEEGTDVCLSAREKTPKRMSLILKAEGEKSATDFLKIIRVIDVCIFFQTKACILKTTDI